MLKRQKLGQHYLVDPDVIRKMVSTAAVRRDEVVLEIGTGKGSLTNALKDVCKSLEGYEVDPANFEETKELVGGRNVRLHLADVFETSPTFDVLVSSLPYSRSSDFVEWLSQKKYDRAVVLLQEDFVEKITSSPGERSYRSISAIAQISSDIRLGDRVWKNAFRPQPRVSSRIVTFLPRIRLRRPQIDLIKRLFSLRRRTLSSALDKAGVGPAASGLDLAKRVYHLSPTEVYQMVSEVSRA